MGRMNAVTEYLKTERGRLKLLAAELGISPAAVAQWKRIPAERVVEVERVTGIPRAKLRPDLYSPAPRKGAA